MQKIKINYLRHGIAYTGGARHEEFLVESIGNALKFQGISADIQHFVANRNFTGLQHFNLLNWAYKNAIADVNIVVGRLALSSILKNKNTHRKTIIVFHYFDDNDGKNKWLELYFKLLFKVLKKVDKHKVAIVVVSPYFLNYFKEKFPQLYIYLFPNLFNNNYYFSFKNHRKTPKVLLGQWSWKNHESVFEAAHLLKKAGYQPYFCTLNIENKSEHKDYSIRHFSFEEYLNEMAESSCSLALSAVNEGWPRMVHESILVGTPVIGFAKGGLKNLLEESNSYIIKNATELLEIIQKKDFPQQKTPEVFYENYDISNAEKYVLPIINFMLNK